MVNALFRPPLPTSPVVAGDGRRDHMRDGPETALNEWESCGMNVLDDKQGAKGNRFPLNPVALKIAGDAILAATLLRASTLDMGAEGTAAVLLALLLGIGTSAISGMQLVRIGQRQLWDVTSLACMAAMAVLLTLHGALFFALVLGAFSVWRWRQLTSASATPPAPPRR